MIDYLKNMRLALREFEESENDYSKIVDCLYASIITGKTIFVGGNGGSAAMADHFVCDFLKGIRQFTKFSPRVISLVANMPLMTAIANDMSYKDTMKFQINSLVRKDDVVFLISSSGNSPNIAQAILGAREQGATVVGLCGFSGGVLKTESDLHLHIKSNDYGVVEDCHSILMHALYYDVREKLA